MSRTIIDQHRNEGITQYVYNVFECDTWFGKSSMEHKAACNTLEDAVNLIMDNGDFSECCDMEYVREFLLTHNQTPLTGDVNYYITLVEVGEWDS